MPVTELQRHQRACEALYCGSEDQVFATADIEEVAEMRATLRTQFNLNVFTDTNFRDLFSAVALIAYRGERIKRACDRTGEDAPA